MRLAHPSRMRKRRLPALFSFLSPSTPDIRKDGIPVHTFSLKLHFSLLSIFGGMQRRQSLPTLERHP